MATAKIMRPQKVAEPEPAAAMQIDAAEPDDGEGDLYTRLKTLQRQLEFLDIQVRGTGQSQEFCSLPISPSMSRKVFASVDSQEDYIKEEQKNLKRELLRAQEEVKRIQSVPLVIGQFLEMVDANSGIVGSTTGSNYYVRILSTLNREMLRPSASVALHRHSNALVDILPPEADSSISLLGDNEKPNVTYQVPLLHAFFLVLPTAPTVPCGWQAAVSTSPPS